MLRLKLLGSPQIFLDEILQERLQGYTKACALLYYLAVTGKPITRSKLAGLIWSDLPENRAKAYLRGELTRLRNTFKLGPYIIASRGQIALDPNSNVEIDLKNFINSAYRSDTPVAALAEAVDSYEGDLLTGFDMGGGTLFDEWLQPERQRIRQLYLDLMLRLGGSLVADREYDGAILRLKQALHHQPWNEKAHQILMTALAHNGQRAQALLQFEACGIALMDELGIDPGKETLALYDQILAGEIGPAKPTDVEIDKPDADESDAPPFQIPAPPLHFAGREAEIVEIADQLKERYEKNVHAVIGMGGIGKSTLATKIAHYLRNEFVDGLLWVDASNGDPLDILGGWAQTFGYDFSSIDDVENRAAAVRNTLKDKRVLIVLDDVSSAARVRSLLPGSASCAVLMTTRDQDTANALQARCHELTVLPASASREILVRILGEERVLAEEESAAEICQLLDHLPLAIEITAQRLAARPHRLRRQAEQLHNVQNRLDLEISDLAVRTSFTVSWETMERRHQRVFMLISLFQGRSFDAAALAAIAQIGDIYWAEDYLFDLAALSLLSTDGTGGTERYRQHALLADFALEQLAEDAQSPASQVDQSSASNRFAEHYLHFAQQNQANFSILQPEWEHIMAGMELSYKAQQWEQVLAYTTALDDVWQKQGRFAEACTIYQQAAEAAQALTDTATLARMLRKQATASLELADDEAAAALLDQSLALSRSSGDRAEEAEVLFHLARLAIEQKQFDQAKALFEQCRQLKSALDDQAGVAHTLYLEADIPYYQGDYDEAKRLAEEAFVIHRAQEEHLGCIQCLGLLADCAIKQGFLNIADTHCHNALTFCDQIGDQFERSAILYIYGEVKRLQEEYVDAVNYLSKALEIFSTIGDIRAKARALLRLGKVELAHGKLENAQLAAEEGLALNRLIDNIWDQVHDLYLLFEIYATKDEEQLAIKMLQEAALLAAIFDWHVLTEQIQLANMEYPDWA